MKPRVDDFCHADDADDADEGADLAMSVMSRHHDCDEYRHKRDERVTQRTQTKM